MGSNYLYAVWWIRQSIYALAEQSRIVRLLNQVGSLNKINKVFAKFEQSLNADLHQELADRLDIPVEKITDTMKVSGRHILWMRHLLKEKTLVC